MGGRALGVAGLSGIVCLFPRAAAAGNLDSFPLGNEAALTAGAVIASTHDAAATWYNPAGLGVLERDSVDGSASALTYRIFHLPQALVVRFPNATQAPDISSSHLLSVPTSLVTARHLGHGVSAGVGLFVQREDLVTGQALIHSAGVAPPYAYSLYADLTEEASTYYAGGAIGWRVAPNVRLGVGLFGVYDTTLSFFSLGASLTGGDGTTASGVYERKASIDKFGLRPMAGIQYDPAPGWELGAVVKGPIFALTGRLELSGMTSASVAPPGGAGQTQFAPLDVVTRTPDAFDVIEPTRVHAGFARRFKRGWIGFSGDYQFPLHYPDGVPMEVGVWNTQVGGRAWIFEHISIGGGVFTDRSQWPRSVDRGTDLNQVERIGSAHIDYYGATLGFEYRRRYAVKEGQEPETHMRGLDFSTTLAGRYAYGQGTVTGNTAEPLTQGALGSSFTLFPANVHEISVHIGSALYF